MGPGGFALCAVLGWAARCARGRWPARSPSAPVPPGVLADPWLSCGCGPGCAAAVGRVALRLWAGLRCGCGLGCAAAVGWVALRLWAGLSCGCGPGCAVGGGPPARHPRRELRSARRLEARPGPATAHGHRSHASRLDAPTRALRTLRCPPHWGFAALGEFCRRVAGVSHL